MKQIIFNTDMVSAILDGRKTVTRRVVKNNPCECESKQVNGICKLCDDKGGFYLPDEYVKVKSPYKPGLVLYVRETFYKDAGRYMYRADYSDNEKFYRDGKEAVIKWRPSIHMPREAARIFLRVTDVRVERLHSMTCSDMVKEGVIPKTVTGGQWQQWQMDYMKPVWDSTIKPADRARYGWDANPWVRVIAFERISKEIDSALCLR